MCTKCQELESKIEILEQRLADIIGENALPPSPLALILTPLETKILLFLVASKVLRSREAIISGVYPDPYDNGPTPNLVGVMISKLRAKGIVIKNIHHQGYFIPPEEKARVRSLLLSFESQTKEPSYANS